MNLLGLHALQLTLLLLALFIGQLHDAIAVLHFQLGDLLLELRAVLVQFSVLALHSIQRLLYGLTLERGFADGSVGTALLSFQLRQIIGFTYGVIAY